MFTTKPVCLVLERARIIHVKNITNLDILFSSHNLSFTFSRLPAYRKFKRKFQFDLYPGSHLRDPVVHAHRPYFHFQF